MKSTNLFGHIIEFDPHLDYGIKNSMHQFGFLNVENFLKKLNHQDKLTVISFLQERIYELKLLIKMKKLLCYINGFNTDDKKESLMLAYMNTIKLFKNILRELKKESFF